MWMGFPGGSSRTGSVSHSGLSDSSPPHGLEPIRLLCSWNSPGKNTGEGSHSLLQGIFLTQGLNLDLPHCRRILYHLSHQGSPLLNGWDTQRPANPVTCQRLTELSGREFRSSQHLGLFQWSLNHSPGGHPLYNWIPAKAADYSSFLFPIVILRTGAENIWARGTCSINTCWCTDLSPRSKATSKTTSLKRTGLIDFSSSLIPDGKQLESSHRPLWSL